MGDVDVPYGASETPETRRRMYPTLAEAEAAPLIEGPFYEGPLWHDEEFATSPPYSRALFVRTGWAPDEPTPGVIRYTNLTTKYFRLAAGVDHSPQPLPEPSYRYSSLVEKLKEYDVPIQYDGNFEVLATVCAQYYLGPLFEADSLSRADWAVLELLRTLDGR